MVSENELPAWAEHAAEALVAAYRADRMTFARELGAVVGFGEEGLASTVLSWMDSAMDAAGVQRPARAALVFVNGETGDLNSVEEVPAAVRWAGQLWSARMCDDKPMVKALLMGLPPLPSVEGLAHLYALACLCASTVRRAQRSGVARWN